MARVPIGGSFEQKAQVRKLIPAWPSWWERVTGIEPALSAWEADVLPLNYTRVDREPRCTA